LNRRAATCAAQHTNIRQPSSLLPRTGCTNTLYNVSCKTIATSLMRQASTALFTSTIHWLTHTRTTCNSQRSMSCWLSCPCLVSTQLPASIPDKTQHRAPTPSQKWQKRKTQGTASHLCCCQHILKLAPVCCAELQHVGAMCELVAARSGRVNRIRGALEGVL
jgi:hypothetical protein